MADGTAPTGAFESYTDFHDFNTQQKDWLPFDVEMTLGSDSLYIPPDRMATDDARYAEHPEAVDEDDEDDDDDMYDYDFPSGVAPTSLADSYDIYRSVPSLIADDPFFPSSYPAPVQSVDPLDLQLDHAPRPSSSEQYWPRFEPASPLALDADTLVPETETPDLIDDSTSSYEDEGFSEAYEFPATHKLASAVVEKDPEVVEPPRARAHPPRSSTSTTKRKKVAHGHHRCEMALPNGEACHKAFTRPYDLARHQETIHAEVRKMFTCPECGDDSKTFSRMDALSRHIRIKHAKRD